MPALSDQFLKGIRTLRTFIQHLVRATYNLKNYFRHFRSYDIGIGSSANIPDLNRISNLFSRAKIQL